MAWQIDTAHSHVSFSVRHMMVSTVRGEFQKILGGEVSLNEEHLGESSVKAEVDAASISTRDANRDNHLRSADFFDVEKYPTITFQSTKIESLGDNEYNIYGDLTLHGVTKPIVLKGEYSGIIKDPYGLKRAGITANGKINRKEFGLTWSALLESGGAVVSDDVKINLDIEVTSQQ